MSKVLLMRQTLIEKMEVSIQILLNKKIVILN